MQPALDSDGDDGDGARVDELTRWLPDSAPGTWTGRPAWPDGMRVIARRERPHPGAPFRLTGEDGWRITCFATNTRGPGWTLPALEVRHRQRARCEDRIRGLKNTGMTNLPYHGFAANQIWLETVAVASDLLAWAQTLAFPPTSPARRWKPKRLGCDCSPWPDGSSAPAADTAPGPAPHRLALGGTHRHRLDPTPHHLTQTIPTPPPKDPENRRPSAGDQPRSPTAPDPRTRRTGETKINNNPDETSRLGNR